AIRGNFSAADDRVEEVVEFVHKRVLPADDVPVRPPVLPVGMERLSDQRVVEAARLFRLIPGPENVELVHALEVELDRPIFAVDLERVEVLASLTEARRLDRADRAVLELEQRDERVIDVDLAGSGAVRQRTFLDERFGDGRGAL